MSLATIISRAQSRIDNLVTQDAGKWSHDWWVGLVNQAKDVLAQETGFNRTRFKIAITKGNQVSALPTGLCWQIESVYIGNSKLDCRSASGMDNDNPGWRFQSSFPHQPTAGDGLKIWSPAAADVGLVATITGLGIDNALRSENVTLTGTTSGTAVETSYLTWTEIYEVALATAGGVPANATGLVTLQTATGALVIATITAGGQSVGRSPQTAQPTNYVIEQPNIEWYPVPDADYTGFARGATLPTDLSGDADAVTGLPSQFEWVVAEGAAALASVADLYTSSQEARQNYSLGAFWAGVKKVADYITALSGDMSDTMPVDSESYYQDFYRSV